MEFLRKWAKPNLPTRMCPHRYCRQLHELFVFMSLGITVRVIFQRPVFLLVGFVLSVMLGVVCNTFIYKNTKSDRTRDELEQISLNENDSKLNLDGSVVNPLRKERTVFPGGLELRRGWARIAIVLDVLLFCLTANAVVTPMADESLSSSSTIIIEIIIAMGFLIMWEVAHRNATRKRRKRRIRFPVGLLKGV